MNADRPSLSIDIRPAEESQIDLLEEQFSPDSNARYHHRRFADQQRGEALYLIAWHGEMPVSHFLLRWHGPTDDPTGRFPPDAAFLEAGATLPAFQRRGVGTRMIQEAERLARERGYGRIGLAVGSTDNPDARRLYERLGYRDWEQGEFVVTWDYETKDGRRGTESEVCVYLLKAL
jgi:GNAT superfamily N-acetyltransferase